MNNFIKKNKNKKVIILDIPLLLENKLNKKKDVLVFVKSNKFHALERLKKRKNFNLKILKKFKKFNFHLITKWKNLIL